MRICSNEKLSFRYEDKEWKLESIPDESNPDCIATLTYTDGSYFNLIAFPIEMPSLEVYKDIVEASLIADDAEIISSEIVNFEGRQSLQVHSHIAIPEIEFDMFSAIFLEDDFLYIFELRAVSDIVSKFMDIVKTFEIKD